MDVKNPRPRFDRALSRRRRAAAADRPLADWFGLLAQLVAAELPQRARAGLARPANVYVTHEHPDHFHMPSIRRLGKGPLYLFPALPETGFVGYLRNQGY